MKTAIIKLSELSDVLRIVELQRDLTVRLHKILEAQKRTSEELKTLKGTATTISKLKDRIGSGKELDTLSDEDRKFINNLLKDRHIKI